MLKSLLLSQSPNPPMIKDNIPLLEERNSVVIRFAGDSGDGMQLIGERFGDATVLSGHDISTYPDYPAEIRAPQGSLMGVSGFQIHFGHQEHVYTPGDAVDALVAMNPAALKVSLSTLKKQGLLVVNTDTFTRGNLKKADYESNPLEEDEIQENYNVLPVAITQLTKEALKESPLTDREKDRSKNIFALGLMYFLFERPLDTTIQWLEKKFGKRQEILNANRTVLEAGYHYGDTLELMAGRVSVKKAQLPPGRYRKIAGNQALALGLIAAGRQAGRSILYAGYPITPASTLLEEMARHLDQGVKTFQGEDEIASIGVAIGASFAGHLGVTGTSGPGMALKSEFANLAVMTELPLVICNMQRGGPSTGLPTKVEQSDLLQALYGRNGESPMPVLAAATPADCFETAFEAVRIALEYNTPVTLLSDGYIANGAEPWLVPDATTFPAITPAVSESGAEDYRPYSRDPETHIRRLAIPGTAGLEHRIGGLEKDEDSNVTSDPDNHEKMVQARAAKVEGIAASLPPTPVFGPTEGDVVILTWGSVAGAAHSAVEYLHREGIQSVSHISLRFINPLPRDLESRLRKFKTVLIPELNLGQLRQLVRARYLIPAEGLHKVRGQPFTVSEIVSKVQELLSK